MIRQHAGKKTKDDYIQRILKSQAYLSGESFTASAISSLLSTRANPVSKETAQTLLGRMEDYGHVRALEFNAKHSANKLYIRSKPLTDLASKPWRKHSNDWIGKGVMAFHDARGWVEA